MSSNVCVLEGVASRISMARWAALGLHRHYSVGLLPFNSASKGVPPPSLRVRKARLIARQVATARLHGERKTDYGLSEHCSAIRGLSSIRADFIRAAFGRCYELPRRTSPSLADSSAEGAITASLVQETRVFKFLICPVRLAAGRCRPSRQPHHVRHLDRGRSSSMPHPAAAELERDDVS